MCLATQLILFLLVCALMHKFSCETASGLWFAEQMLVQVPDAKAAMKIISAEPPKCLHQ